MFVTFEGPEGAGKSTVIEKLAVHMKAAGHDVLCTREPGAGALGKAIREILLEGEGMPPLSELFLFLADRANHVATIIRPALESGKIVLCDRYSDSTVVYQGVARGLGATLLRQLNEIATENLIPNLTILLDLEPEIGLSRVTDSNRLDKEPAHFHDAVRVGFFCEASLDENRWRIVDASQPLEAVIHECLNHILARLD